MAVPDAAGGGAESLELLQPEISNEKKIKPKIILVSICHFLSRAFCFTGYVVAVLPHPCVVAGIVLLKVKSKGSINNLYCPATR